MPKMKIKVPSGFASQKRLARRIVPTRQLGGVRGFGGVREDDEPPQETDDGTPNDKPEPIPEPPFIRGRAQIQRPLGRGLKRMGKL